MGKNLYEILGVEKTASQEEIEKAFKSSAKFFHPDMHPNANDGTKEILEEMFKEINHAYSVLSDQKQKEKYDYELKYQEELAKKESAKEEPLSISGVFRSIVTDIKEEFEDALKPIIEEPEKVVEENYPEYSEEKEENEQDHLFQFNIKNSKLLALVLTGAIVITTLACYIFKKPDEPLEPTNTYITSTTDDAGFTSNKITLTRIYRVEEGDTMESLAEHADTTTDAIKKRNNISEDTSLEVGSVLVIPYCYNINDIPYFTDSVSYDGNTTIGDIADKYGTTVGTLKELNSEAMTNEGDILSSSILVPNFISPKTAEAKSLAESNGYQYSYGQ